MPGAHVYILECHDGSLYVGSTSKDHVEERVSEHELGIFDGYTAARRPVKLVWSEHFERIVDAVAFEHQVKRWSRAKKLALIRRDWRALQLLAKRHGGKR